MSWPKKNKTLKGCQERIEGLEEKRKELIEDLERVQKRVQKHQTEVQELLGASVLGDHTTEVEKELTGAKKLLGAALEREADIKYQLGFIDSELKVLSVEMDEASLKEVPAEMEKVASEFNQTLDAALEALPILMGLHDKAWELETKFYALSNARQNSLSRLGRTEGLEVKQALGKLALVPPPGVYVQTGG